MDRKMLRWNKLIDTEQYVLDLTQHESGIRKIKLRSANDERHVDTVLISRAYTGAELKRWMRELALTKNVELENGGTFVEEAHSGWFTSEEFAFRRLPSELKNQIPPEEWPWFNGKPPLIPPK